MSFDNAIKALSLDALKHVKDGYVFLLRLSITTWQTRKRV